VAYLCENADGTHQFLSSITHVQVRANDYNRRLSRMLVYQINVTNDGGLYMPSITDSAHCCNTSHY
jgi:hypothetical protein